MILNVPNGGPASETGAPAARWADPHRGGQHVVRQDILTSWQRCVVAGLSPDRFEVPYQADVDDDGRRR
jgi:hypothetical protein